MSPSNARSETDLWSDYVSALAAALEMRKPDALARVRLAVEKLDREISALVIRRELIARVKAGEVRSNSFQAALNEFEHWKAGDTLTSHLEAQIGALEARMADLRGLASRVRATPLDHDYNCTPETAVKASEIVNGDGEYTGEYISGEIGIQDLNDELKRAAMDIRSGWLVVTKGAAYAISGKSPGTLDVGKRAEALRKQYLAFIPELHRKRMGTWALDDVVCEGLSRAECAQKRRCRIEQVYDQLVTGLNLYAETYPPLSDGEG